MHNFSIVLARDYVLRQQKYKHNIYITVKMTWGKSNDLNVVRVSQIVTYGLVYTQIRDTRF